MRLHGRSLPRAEKPIHETSAYNAWDLMYIVQSVGECKPVKKKTFSFSHFRK